MAPYIRSSEFEKWAKLNEKYMAPLHVALIVGLKTKKSLMKYEHALVGKGNNDRAQSLWRGSEKRIRDLLKSSPELVSAILTIKQHYDKIVQFYISKVSSLNESGKLSDLKENHNKHYLNKHIKEISIKAIDLKRRGYEQEYKTATTLVNILEEKTNDYFSKSDQEKCLAIETYKKECTQAIDRAMPILERHRDLKKLLGNLLLAFATLVLGYLVAVIINKAYTGRCLFDKFTIFDPPKTAQKLESCKNIISTMSQPLVINSR